MARTARVGQWFSENQGGLLVGEIAIVTGGGGNRPGTARRYAREGTAVVVAGADTAS